MLIKYKNKSGFTLIEVLIGIVILAIMLMSLYSLINFTLKTIWEAKAKITATQLANQKIELAHNLDYDDVGTIGGVPSGLIQATEIVSRNNIEYTVQTQIIYIDDPFDGTLGGDPDDLLNTDYKKIRVEVSWDYRLQNKPVLLISNIVPIGLESSVGGGTLKILVYNALGEPVPQANVSVINSLTDPVININTQTDDQGYLILPGSPESTESYEIIITKTGYSTDQTRDTTVELPSPEKPHASVFENQTTNISFSIDLLSDMTTGTTITTYDNWWNSNWSKRQPIFINNSHSTLSNYSVEIEINYDSDMQTDFDDIRFTDQNNVELKYWLEDFDSGDDANFWVKIPTLPQGSSFIYVYYGNANANTTSDSSQAFLWFDNFESRSLGSIANQGDWDGVGGYNPYNVYSQDCYQGSKVTLPSKNFGEDVLLDYWAKLTQKGNDTTSDFNITTHDTVAAGDNWDRVQHRGEISTNKWSTTIKYVGDSTSRNINLNQWQHFQIRYYNNDRTDIVIDGHTVRNNEQTYVNNLDYFNLYNDEYDRGYYDKMVIRRYKSPEPYVYNFGTEEDRIIGASAYLANIPIVITSEKIIGYDADEQPVYKYTGNYTTGYNGLIYIENLEWDSYTFSLPETSAYIISETTPVQPLNLLPNTTSSVMTLDLSPKATHSVLIIIKDINEEPIDNATVHLYTSNPSYDETLITDESGQVYFAPWISGDSTLEISATGYENYSDSFDLSGYHIEEIILIQE